MEIPKEVVKQAFDFQIDRQFSQICKSFISILEDIKLDHEQIQARLNYCLPKEYASVVKIGDCLSQEKFISLRKKTLDVVNDCKREVYHLISLQNQFNLNDK